MLLPKRHVSINSSKSVEEIIRTLRSMTDEANSVYKINNRNLLFFGTVDAPEFVIYNMPIEMARNFLIEIRGNLVNDVDSVRIDLDLRPVRFIRVFTILWISFVSLFFVLSFFLFQDITPKIIAAAMFVFGFLLVNLCFIFHANRAQKILFEVLLKKIPAEMIQRESF